MWDIFWHYSRVKKRLTLWDRGSILYQMYVHNVWVSLCMWQWWTEIYIWSYQILWSFYSTYPNLITSLTTLVQLLQENCSLYTNLTRNRTLFGWRRCVPVFQSAPIWASSVSLSPVSETMAMKDIASETNTTLRFWNALESEAVAFLRTKRCYYILKP